MPELYNIMPYSDTKNVIVISSTPYHFTWQAVHTVSEAFIQRGWQVVFVEPPPKRFPGWRELRRVWGRVRDDAVMAGISPQREIAGICMVLPLTLPDRTRLLRWINRRWLLPRLARQIRPASADKPLVVSLLPTQGGLDLIDLVEPAAVIYICMLNFPRDPLAPTDVAATEAALARRADLVFVDLGLDNQERLAALNLPRPLKTITSSVKYDLFAQAQSQRPLHQPPVCCFFGDIRGNVDLDLLKLVCERYQLHVIGTNTNRIPWQHPHLQRLEQVPHDRLPALLAETDIILLPYRQDDPYNRGVFPAKVYEALATGKPVISIGLLSLVPLAAVIDIASSHAEFLDLIDRACRREGTPAGAARRAQALAIAKDADVAAVYDRVFAAINPLVAGAAAGVSPAERR